MLHSNKILRLRKHILIISFIIVPCISYAYDPGLPDSVIFGNLDGSHITALPGDIINIPVWIKNDEGIAAVQLSLATEDQFVVERLGGVLYDFLTFWDMVEFFNPYSDLPETGYTSQMLAGINELFQPWDDSLCNTQGNWLLVADFTILISSDPANLGQSFQLIEGEHPYLTNGLEFSDPTGMNTWIPDAVFGIVDIGYKYLPGDANMHVGLWPPAVLNSDVTYLSGYFRGNPANPPCNLDGFWASADANGDCSVLGSDITRLIYYFRGLAEIEYCPDYEPFDLPPIMPSGWPNCESIIMNVKVIPAEIKGLE